MPEHDRRPAELARLLVDAFGGGQGTVDEAAAGEALVGMLAGGRMSWPGVDLAEPAFVTHVAERLRGHPRGLAALRELHGADLFLACAVAHQDARAIWIVSQEVFSRLDGTIARIVDDGAGVDEVKQRLRRQLLVLPAVGPPRIAAYQGRGALVAWLRIAAAREALKLRRGDLPVTLDDYDDRLMSLPLAADDAELASIARVYRPQLKAAIADAVVTLSAEDQHLLRSHHLQGRTIDDLAQELRVHRATAARWVTRARTRLGKSIKRELRRRLGLTRKSCDSLMGVFIDDPEITLGVLRS